MKESTSKKEILQNKNAKKVTGNGKRHPLDTKNLSKKPPIKPIAN